MTPKMRSLLYKVDLKRKGKKVYKEERENWSERASESKQRRGDCLHRLLLVLPFFVERERGHRQRCVFGFGRFIGKSRAQQSRAEHT